MKKLIAFVLLLAMLATLTVTVISAAEEPENEQDQMQVLYSVAPSFYVTIPETVTIDGDSVTVSATDVVVLKGDYVSVSLATTNNFVVTTDEGATLEYAVKMNGSTITAGTEILAVNPEIAANGSATISFTLAENAKIKFAGTYKGAATFVISVNKVD